MRILVSGLMNLETNVGVEHFPVEYCPIEYAFHRVNSDISGVAYNIVSALNRLGDAVLPVTLIGKDDVGQLISHKLSAMGCETRFVRQELEKTCTSVILYDDWGTRKIYCDLKDIQERVFPYGDVRAAAADCDGLVICNINFNDELIYQARELGKPIFTDVHVLSNIYDDYNRRFLEHADVVFLSDEGLPCSPEHFLRSIYETYHNRVIVLGEGEKGALMWLGEEQRFYHLPAVYTRPVMNTVGAGDALFSCFVHCYLQGMHPCDCLKRAVAFASYKIGESGGARGFASAQQLEELVNT